MRNILLIACVAVSSLMASPYEVPGDGARIDYLDYNGNRIRSKIVDKDNINVIAFSVYQNYDDGKYLLDDGYENFNSIKIVPWGTEKYPLEISTDNDKVDVTYEIVNGNRSARNICKSTSEDVLCGTVIKFTIITPGESYPQLTVEDDYTHVDFDGNPIPYTLTGCGFSGLSNRPYFTTSMDAFCMESRQYLLNEMESYGVFERDSDNPNKYYYTHVMGNEPQSLTFGLYSPDGRLLNDAVLNAIATLYFQHQDNLFGLNSCNGEPYLSHYYGDAIGADFISPMEIVYTVGEQDGIMPYFDRADIMFSRIPYTNYMSMVAEVNLRLSMLDKYTATQSEKNIAKAKLMCVRSHAYLRLMQIYGARWNESSNGATLCVPLETYFNTENVAPATMKTIADQCTNDLREAINIFAGANYTREYLIEPDANVARMILMRFALLREDWATVKETANAVLGGIPLTTNDEMTAGFTTSAPSWIWGAWNEGNLNGTYYSLYYWSFQAMNACNGAYPANWGIGTNAISRELYLGMGDKDIRRSLYVMPERFSNTLKSVDKWYDASSFISNRPLILNGRYSEIVINYFSQKKPAGVQMQAFTFDDKKVPILFGSQVKFYQPGYQIDDPAPVLFMRSEEALLSLAEAYYHLGNEQGAREELSRLESMRNPDFSSSNLSGQSLLDAIKLSRRVELWGEGFSWFDLKRWNQPRIRHEWIEGDTSSGNWYQTLQTVSPSDFNGWRLVIPQFAVANNPLIDISKYGYTSASGYQTPQSQPSQHEVKMNRENGMGQQGIAPVTTMEECPHSIAN